MKKGVLYTAMQIGSNSIKTITSTIGRNGNIQVIGFGNSKPTTLNDDLETNNELLNTSIKTSLSKAQRYIGKKVKNAFVGIGSSDIHTKNITLTIEEKEATKFFSNQNQLDKFKMLGLDSESDLIVYDIVPRSYLRRDINQNGTTDSKYMDIETSIIIGSKRKDSQLKKAISKCGITPSKTILSHQAIGEGCLTETEKELGIILIDIGATTTKSAIFKNGQMIHASCIKLGGNQVTNDLAKFLNIPFYVAENIKQKWGTLIRQQSRINEIKLPGFHGLPTRTIYQDKLYEPLSLRILEIVRLSIARLRNSGMKVIPRSGIVVTGGTARLPGIEKLISELVMNNCRIGYPSTIAGFPQELQTPENTEVAGLLITGIKEITPNPIKQPTKLIDNFKLFKKFLHSIPVKQ